MFKNALRRFGLAVSKRVRARGGSRSSGLPPTSLLVSILITEGDGTAAGRRATVASLEAQTHRHWRLETASDTASHRGEATSGDRDLMVLVSSGDVLHPEALAELAHHAEREPLVDVLYTDEEQEVPDAARREPFLKPDWSPELLLSLPYVLHCLGVRRDVFSELGGLAPDAPEAQAYDFALRATGAGRRVDHIRRVLCRRPASVDTAEDAELGAVAAAATLLSPRADAAAGLVPGTYRLVRRRDQRPPVTLVVISADPLVPIEGRGERRILADFVHSIVELSSYPDYRVLVAADRDLSDASAAALHYARGRVACCKTDSSAPFNFSRKVNFAIDHVDTEHFILLNDDLVVIAPQWIEALMDYAVIPSVGAVGAYLEFPDGRTQHAGVIAATGGPTHRFYRLGDDAQDANGPRDVVRNFSAVTAAVLASRRDVVEAVGPFDEAFPHCYNDVDFCLRARQRGYRVVYTPFSRLIHFEHASIKSHGPTAAELALFRDRWGAWCEHDPYYRRACT